MASCRMVNHFVYCAFIGYMFVYVINCGTIPNSLNIKVMNEFYYRKRTLQYFSSTFVLKKFNNITFFIVYMPLITLKIGII